MIEQPKDIALFEHEVLRAFFFLMSNFAFGKVETAVRGPECVVRFANVTTGVSVKFELLTGPWVELARLDRTTETVRTVERYDFNFLMMERVKGWQRFNKCNDLSDPALPHLLDELADKLRKYATDVLTGDFSVFPRLRERAEANLLQTNKELFGTDLI